MSDGTKIEWADATWNLVNGCTVVSPGCEDCYAMRLAATRLRNSPSRAGTARLHKGKPQWTGEILFNKAVALDPFRWSRPRLIFVNAHGDTFHADVPDSWIDFIFFMAIICPQHTFQILTKRPERMREYMQMVLDETEEQTAGRFAAAALHAGLSDHPRVRGMDLHWPPRNCWLGTSVEDQERADERIPALVATPAVRRWLSCEPLLGPVDLHPWLLGFDGGNPATCACGHGHGFSRCRIYGGVSQGCSRCNCQHFRKSLWADGIHWVVVGGESGTNSRPMHPGWARSLRDACRAAGVPLLFKQWGDWLPSRDFAHMEISGRAAPFPKHKFDDTAMYRVGKKTAGRELDGRTWDEYPEIAA